MERVTSPTLDVLEALLDAFDRGMELHGWGIMTVIKRSGPTVYGVLDRLEDAGWVSGRWEDQPTRQGKPRRRYYSLSPTGAVAVRELLEARRPQARRRSADGLAFPAGLQPLYLDGSQ